MWAGVDSAWEQEKLEASLPWRARPGRNARKFVLYPPVQCTLCWAYFRVSKVLSLLARERKTIWSNWEFSFSFNSIRDCFLKVFSPLRSQRSQRKTYKKPLWTLCSLWLILFSHIRFRLKKHSLTNCFNVSSVVKPTSLLVYPTNTSSCPESTSNISKSVTSIPVSSLASRFAVIGFGTMLRTQQRRDRVDCRRPGSDHCIVIGP